MLLQQLYSFKGLLHVGVEGILRRSAVCIMNTESFVHIRMQARIHPYRRIE